MFFSFHFSFLKSCLKSFSQKEGSLRQKLRELSGKFFTIIPHRIGRSKMEVEKNIIDTFGILEAKQELLQLMKDLLEVTSEGAFQGGGVGGKSLSVVEMQFKALKNEIFVLNHDSRFFSLSLLPSRNSLDSL